MIGSRLSSVGLLSERELVQDDKRGRSSLAVVGCGLQQKRSASQAILCIVFLQFDKDLTPSLKRPPPAITLHLDTMMTYDDHRRI